MGSQGKRSMAKRSPDTTHTNNTKLRIWENRISLQLDGNVNVMKTFFTKSNCETSVYIQEDNHISKQKKIIPTKVTKSTQTAAATTAKATATTTATTCPSPTSRSGTPADTLKSFSRLCSPSHL